ncbi:MAG: hypothetical protein A2729_00075 [Candidatus Buchananbacteria bacterium RIFCSPHIGHO2_01_FULL_39_14]|uniref:General secretion pathway GspH domain-containing protein n=2 Tax=Candidatus Buchananiibacteriota TaxID=1817903 RepID=A0A1G1YTD4_9BACT|nr:MAG: hypothetical protein A2729_00075 [Candidatus Buchananbacteria bacterium RIFCSPHIGHO2_01_FULL_39_14]OGY49389.1 MAG: hypothetical protein A3D39_00720 [Candidatus Buchananbacteria bacterium RIFCSPHIGHO2_02_FULL_39_17]OGY55608.1 MAG: hypothetical protein A2912_05360 [Candidatus Buchananbacteria bacterium RIFCSPLOWO2_01_FULL_40_23b]
MLIIDYNKNKVLCPKSAGFTIVEILIILGVLAIVATLSLPFIQSFQVSSDLTTYSEQLTQTLRRAQQKAMAGQNNSAWGVYFNNGQKKVILFKGVDYGSRDSDFDEEISYPPSFSVNTDFSGLIFFNLYRSSPSVGGIVTITSQNNESKNITINELGIIQLIN